MPETAPGIRYELHHDKLEDTYEIRRVEVVGVFEIRAAARQHMIATTEERRLRDAGGVVHIGAADSWPPAVSDGLSLPCSDCCSIPAFDYQVEPEFWALHVPGDERTGVVCLPCLDERCGGVGLAEAIRFIHWTGTAHTVVLEPTRRYTYDDRAEGHA